MKIFGINDGHTKQGPGSGAVGLINESEETRRVGSEVRRLLSDRGNKVYNCTVDYSNTTSENLALIIQQANRQDLDWFISIHFNAGGGKGVEVYTYEGRQYQDAVNVCKNISKLLDIPNRGVKSGTGLYVVRKTKAKSMLIEVCFVDTDDANKYKSISCTKVAEAIVSGILNTSIDENKEPTTSQPEPMEPTNNFTLRLQKELNKQGFTDHNGNKILEDGFFGPLTLSACPIVKKGASGGLTKLIQERVGTTVDGLFGPNTTNAVMIYQGNNGLSKDGVVGPNTWARLSK